MHNLTCAACGRALAETSAWKGSGERFYCNDFCVEADSGDLVLTAYLIKCDAMLSGIWLRAQEARTVADQMTHEQSRTSMRRIAMDYDRLAKLADVQLADQEATERKT